MSNKIYLNKTVFQAALERIEFLFNEFNNIYVSFSGGKDSTICLYLTLLVAEKLNRLPVKVMFIDQEAEWQTVIDYIRVIMQDKRITPYWLQIPIQLFNATSNRERWLQCWEPGVKWIREKEKDSIHDNVYGTKSFKKVFGKFLEYYHPDEKACHIAGVRAEESPARKIGLTCYETYKSETWGAVENKKLNHYVFYPIYDWSYTDVWKAIHDNGWPYCKVYDYMYQYGVSIRNMRVSNVHHETAVKTLYYLQEIENDTWNKIVKRIPGINTAGILGEQWGYPKELPFMFDSWTEYRDHLLENLIPEDKKGWYKKTFKAKDKAFDHNPEIMKRLLKVEISMLLVNDCHGTKLQTFYAANGRYSKGSKYYKGN